MQQYQSVIVTNEKLEHHGQAGHVVEAEKNGVIGVRIDADNTVYEFKTTDVRAL